MKLVRTGIVVSPLGTLRYRPLLL